MPGEVIYYFESTVANENRDCLPQVRSECLGFAHTKGHLLDVSTIYFESVVALEENTCSFQLEAERHIKLQVARLFYKVILYF